LSTAEIEMSLEKQACHDCY